MTGDAVVRPVPTQAGRAVGLDLVRFSAAVMVVTAHLSPAHGLSFELPDAFADLGGTGVSLFFALSGYLLWRPFVTGNPRLGAYAANRFARIVPGFWLACVVLVPLRGGDISGYLTFLPDRGTPLGVIWTLQAEILFYISLPYVARLRRPLAVPIIGGLLSLALELAISGTPLHATLVETLTPIRFWAFAPGMLLAAWQPRTDWRWLVAGIGMLVLGGLYLPYTPGGGQFVDVPTVIGAGLIVGWGIHARPRGAWLWSAGAAISYSLYLWHVDVFTLLGDVGLPAVFVIASVSYVLVERPVMQLVKARTSRRPTPGRVFTPVQAGLLQPIGVGAES